jgi:hypothetical protein
MTMLNRLNASDHASKTLTSDPHIDDEPTVALEPADLTRGEKNLWQIFWRSCRIAPNKFNLGVSIGTILTLAAYAWYTKETGSALADRVRSWTDLGLGFAPSILGFLIAGFTVFATLTKPELFIAMAKHPKKGLGMSTLKYNFYTFMGVFIHFLTFFGLCLAIKFLAGQNGPISVFLGLLTGKYASAVPHIKRFIAGIGIVGVGTYFAFVTLLLKSFVYDIYHVTMTSIRWTWEEEERKGNK